MAYPVEFVEFCLVVHGKMTALRKEVLFILWRSKKPLKAYEILNVLHTVQPHAKPTSVYRVLDFLVASGLVHKIDFLQAYALCTDIDSHASSEIMLVCHVCHRVLEIFDALIHRQLFDLAKFNHFTWEEGMIELKGLCQDCAKKNPCSH